MTNKEFFLKVLEDEKPKFVRAVRAIPEDKIDYKPHEKARTAGRIAFQLASQPFFIAAIATTGAPDWGTYREPENPNLPDMLALMEKNFANLEKALHAIADDDWESGTALMQWKGGKWETKKYDMAWGFFFDAIHHRGQLTTYLRAMGAKVPGIYGGSADETPVAG